MNSDEKFMSAALLQADCAFRRGEVPVGAVVVRDGKIIARAYNTRETGKNALHHAEIKAVDRACKRLGGWRLIGCTLYVTLEPCPMCAGAIVNSRIERVVYGARDEKAGAFGTRMDINEFGFNHRPIIEGGVLEERCSAQLTEFFRWLRTDKQRKKDGK